MKALFIGAHPDDIEFSCAGTIARMAKKITVVCLVYTDGGDSRRPLETTTALTGLGVKDVVCFGKKDGFVTDDKDAVGEIQALIERERPTIVFTHSPIDSHQDHRRLSLAVKSAVRRRHSLVFFDSYSAVDFVPNFFVNITDYEEEKRSAIRAHKTQVEKYAEHGIDFEAFAIAKNRVHGFESGCELAEAFKVEGAYLW